MRTVLLISCIAISLPMFALVSGCGPSGPTTDQTIEESATGDGAMGGAENAEEPTAAAGMNVGADAAVRPGSVPEDMPNIAGAKNFGWLSIAGNDMFSFEVTGQAYRDVCADEIALLTNAGWRVSTDGYEMDVDGALVKTLENPGYTLIITCGDNTEEGSTVTTISVALNRSKK